MQNEKIKAFYSELRNFYIHLSSCDNSKIVIPESMGNMIRFSGKSAKDIQSVILKFRLKLKDVVEKVYKKPDTVSDLDLLEFNLVYLSDEVYEEFCTQLSSLKNLENIKLSMIDVYYIGRFPAHDFSKIKTLCNALEKLECLGSLELYLPSAGLAGKFNLNFPSVTFRIEEVHYPYSVTDKLLLKNWHGIYSSCKYLKVLDYEFCHLWSLDSDTWGHFCDDLGGRSGLEMLNVGSSLKYISKARKIKLFETLGKLHNLQSLNMGSLKLNDHEEQILLFKLLGKLHNLQSLNIGGLEFNVYDDKELLSIALCNLKNLKHFHSGGLTISLAMCKLLGKYCAQISEYDFPNDKNFLPVLDHLNFTMLKYLEIKNLSDLEMENFDRKHVAGVFIKYISLETITFGYSEDPGLCMPYRDIDSDEVRSDMTPTPEQWEVFCFGLAQCEKLQTLNLQLHYISEEGAKALASLIVSSYSCKDIVLNVDLTGGFDDEVNLHPLYPDLFSYQMAKRNKEKYISDAYHNRKVYKSILPMFSSCIGRLCPRSPLQDVPKELIREIIPYLKM